MNGAATYPPRTVALADIGRGFEQPVHDAQQVFRAVLDAMARPGRLQSLPPSVLAALQPPAALGAGLAAVLLTLLDGETTLHLGDALAHPNVARYLRFHSGVRLVTTAAEAAFVALPADALSAGLLPQLHDGSDEAPHLGATLVVEVTSLQADGHAGDDAVRLELRGPGIEQVHTLAVGGVPREVWQERIAMQAHLPRGVELILSCGATLAAIPRTTRVTLLED